MKHFTKKTNLFPRIISLLIPLFLLIGLSGASGTQAQSQIIHPVILIHGFNSSPSTWDTDASGEGLYDYLIRQGYSAEYIVKFAYPPGRGYEEDSRGDIYLIAEKLVTDAAALSQKSVNNGGPAKVDVVAHSLGGLITRQYLANNFYDHDIGTFIDIGTPHSGVILIDIYNELADDVAEWLNPLPYNIYNDLFRDIIDEFYSQVMGEEGLKWPDPTTPAGQQLAIDSEFLRLLNQPGKSPLDVDYNMLYGNITLNFAVNLFGWDIKPKEIISLGDMLVARKNAATIPYLGTLEGPNPANYHTYNFDGPVTLKLTLALALPKLEILNYDEAKAQVLLVHHGGLIRNQKVFDTIYAILQGNAPQPPIITPTTPAPVITTSPPSFISANTSTVLVFDTSSSMRASDPSGMTKLEAAQKAGGNILDIIEAENQANPATTSQIGIVEFNTYTDIKLQLSTDISAARSALQSLSAKSNTGMPDGLKAGIDVLNNKPAGSSPMIILLSDGLPNIGLGGDGLLDVSAVKQQVLDLASQAASKGICIYTIGFGDPQSGSIDPDFLRQVATTSGCGDYYSAQQSIQLANVYVDVRHTSTGSVLLQQDGQIAQGQQVSVASVNVPSNQSQLLYTLNWPGSKITAVLIDPKGLQVDSNYPGASFHTTNSLASVIIQNPLEGAWQVLAQGIEVPQATTAYHAVLSVRTNTVSTPTPTSGGFPIALIIILLGGGFVAIYVLFIRTRGQRPVLAGLGGFATPPGEARLIMLSGAYAGQSISLYDGLTIGRNRTCGICLIDGTVSRQHAILRYTQSGWFIQDQGSTGGTYVNNLRQRAVRLRTGDQIRIGNTLLEFRG